MTEVATDASGNMAVAIKQLARALAGSSVVENVRGDRHAHVVGLCAA